ncbi:MAG: cytochrome c oxidase subunit II [Magnetococcales bacterium]|nr:cytochrome c oxidase subunit II [Magnetococcales bacterium]
MKKMLATLTGIALVVSSAIVMASESSDTIKDPAEEWQHLWTEVLVDLYILGGIFGALAIYWLFKYRAKDPDAVGDGPNLSRAQVWAWAIVPCVLFLADDLYLGASGWSAWNVYRNVPENAMEVKVTGSMWNWEFEYEDGTTSTYDVDGDEGEKGDGLVVPVGTPVALRMTSTDVIHSFGLTKYRVKEDLMPGRVTYIWFYPKEEAKSWVTCTEFCGASHARMYAPVKAIPQAKFENWLAKRAKEEAEE